MAKRILLNIFIFLGVFIGMAFSLANVPVKGRPVWCYLNKTIMLKGGQALSMTTELEELKKQDGAYLLVGSSHAYRGYDPKLFSEHGINLFNAGSSGQSLACSYELLKRYGHKFSKVILDLYPGSISKVDDEALLTLIQNTPNDEFAMKLFTLKPGIFSVNNLLYRFFRTQEQPLYSDPRYEGRGYESTETELKKTVNIPHSQFDESQFTLVKSIIDYCKRSNMEITLVSHPLPFPSGDDMGYYYFKYRLDELCSTSKVSFYDYTYRHSLDNTFFSDNNHLNVKGVRFFNGVFIKEYKAAIKNVHLIGLSELQRPNK